MRKFYLAIIMIIIFSLIGVTAFAENNEKVTLDKQSIKQGYIKVGYTSIGGQAIKVMIEKENKKYIYNLRNDGVSESFPLQMGNGDYSINILENIEGDKYNGVYKETVNVKLSNSNTVFLNSIQNINWDQSMKAIKKAKEITKGLKTQNEKIAAIYNYVVTNFKYDYDKFNNLPGEYVPNIDKTISQGKGICYDYSSLFASMLRSSNISVKLVKGYSKDVKGYHAWNEVYQTSTGKWITVDTTYDSQLKAAKIKYSMVKNVKEYTAVNVY